MKKMVLNGIVAIILLTSSFSASAQKAPVQIITIPFPGIQMDQEKVCYSATQILEKAVTTEGVDIHMSGKTFNFLLVHMAFKEDQSGFYIKKGVQYCWIVSGSQKMGSYFPFAIRKDSKSRNLVELVYREGSGYIQNKFIDIYDCSRGELIAIKDPIR